MNTSNNRRSFLKKAGAASGAILFAGASSITANKISSQKKEKPGFFKLKYAPHLSMFKESAGKDPIDNIKFIHDNGFRAIFDNGLINKEPTLQEKIASELANRNMDMGPFVLYADFKVTSFVENSKEVRDMLKQKMQNGIELAKRTGAKWALVVPGRYHNKLAWEYQTANVIQNLRYCCDLLENTDLSIVMEPLNSIVNHPGLFLTKIPQAYMICKAVNNPKCKIVDDLYHQQIQEGNLIYNMKMAYDEIGAFHLGDNPGRNEPTTGEINYKNIFKTLYEMDYNGTLCCEHGKSQKGKEGEMAVIKAYRECDSF